MNFPHNGTNPYPFRDEIFPDEDGVGYALRMGDANALTFHQLAVHLATPGHLYLPYSAAPSLAFMFGGTTSLISRALVRRHFLDGVTAADFMGYRFSRPKHLRQTYPQVCPICLLDDRRTQASWSITLMCCCTKHNICLVDRCVCGRPVLWRRRSLLVCECGRTVFGLGRTSRRATSGALAICQQIEYLLGNAHFRLRSQPDGILSIFDDVTLDTFLRLVWALGHSDIERSGSAQGNLNAILTPLEAELVDERAYNHIRELTVERRPGGRLWRHHLASIAKDAVTTPDRQILASIVTRLTAPSRGNQRKRGTNFIQLNLWDEYEGNEGHHPAVGT